MSNFVYDESRWDFSRFEEPAQKYNRTSTAKAVKKTQPKLKVIQNKKTVVRANKKMIGAKILSVSIAAILLACFYINSQIAYDEAVRERTKYQEELHLIQSINIGLDSKLNSKFSLRDIEDFAVNKLGMRKVESQQVVYIDLSNKDEVILCDN